MEETQYRDKFCGHLREEHVGREMTLVGWVHQRRKLGGLFFIDLRDRSGQVQLSIEPDQLSEPQQELLDTLNPEDVIQVEGEVQQRPPEARNEEMDTGQVELMVSGLQRLSQNQELPLLVATPPEEELASEELRLRHRVLDLRRPEMQENFGVRSRAMAGAREVLEDENFWEIETPLLTRRTPEGARDFLIPNRRQEGEFYALPQSPQLYKQLLMLSGMERYYQMARCLRDESLRSDRQLEFTQLDLEMSFVDQEDVIQITEMILENMWEQGTGEAPQPPFEQMTYDEALERFGTDRPDLRIPWEIQDFSEELGGLGFQIIDKALNQGERARGIGLPPEAGSFSRQKIEQLEEAGQEGGLPGLLWTRYTPHTQDPWSGPLAKWIQRSGPEPLVEKAGLEEGGLLLIAAGGDRQLGGGLNAVRQQAWELLGHPHEEQNRWLWVVDFPLFEATGEGDIQPAHHPFTRPHPGDESKLLTDPLAVKAQAYDVVLNGMEVGGGSIREHRPAMQRRILRSLGMTSQEIEDKFGFFLEQFEHGAPPHGGIAIGMDRAIALMTGHRNIREVIAFPKTTAGRGLLEQAPNEISATELEELGLRLKSESVPRGVALEMLQALWRSNPEAAFRATDQLNLWEKLSVERKQLEKLLEQTQTRPTADQSGQQHLQQLDETIQSVIQELGAVNRKR